MPYEHGGDKMCVILGVSQQPKRLYDWKKALCDGHAGMDFYTKTVLVYNRSPCNALHCIALRRDAGHGFVPLTGKTSIQKPKIRYSLSSIYTHRCEIVLGLTLCYVIP